MHSMMRINVIMELSGHCKSDMSMLKLNTQWYIIWQIITLIQYCSRVILRGGLVEHVRSSQVQVYKEI